jgi:NAD(P)-dependent dehydrogenase (short-subunit alcohol dehydrogenase family)
MSAGGAGGISDVRLKDKVAVVTGAATGLGFETARLFFEEGASVAGVYHARYDARRIADAFGGSDRVVYLKADVTRSSEVESLAFDVGRRFGRVSVLVNNAGVSSVGTVEETTEEEFRRVMEVNVLGMFLVTKHFLPLLKKEKAGAAIVNVASNIGVVGMAGRIAYTTSKGAVINFTRSLALDCAAHGIRANAVAPGAILTEMVEDFLKTQPSEEFRRRIARLHAMNRFAEPAEIAKAILFLAGGDSSYATGAVFSVDGGYTAGK